MIVVVKRIVRLQPHRLRVVRERRVVVAHLPEEDGEVVVRL